MSNFTLFGIGLVNNIGWGVLKTIQEKKIAD